MKNKTDYPEYRVWAGMKSRCLNENSQKYHLYGGRGIKICKEWLDSFYNFYNDMGPRPTDKHSIDRIDSDGNYEPNNCRWATAKEQASNRKKRPELKNHRKHLVVGITLNEGNTTHKKIIDALENGLLKDQGYATTMRQLALAGVRAKKEQS